MPRKVYSWDGARRCTICDSVIVRSAYRKKQVATAWLTHHAAVGRFSPAECVQAGWFDCSRKILRGLRGQVTRGPRPVCLLESVLVIRVTTSFPLSFLDSRIVDQYEIRSRRRNCIGHISFCPCESSTLRRAELSKMPFSSGHK